MKKFLYLFCLIPLSAFAENSDCRDKVKEQIFKDISSQGLDSALLYDSKKPKECNSEKFKRSIESSNVPDPGGPDDKGAHGTIYIWDNLYTTTRNSRGVYKDSCNKSADNFSSSGERDPSKNCWDYIQESNKEIARVVKSWDSKIDNIFEQSELLKSEVESYSEDQNRFRFDKMKPKEKKELESDLKKRYEEIFRSGSVDHGFGYFRERFSECPTTINYVLGLRDFASVCSYALTKTMSENSKCDTAEILKSSFPKTDYDCTWSPKTKGDLEEPKTVSFMLDGKEASRRFQKCTKALDCVGKNKKKFSTVAVCRSEYCASSSPAMCMNDDIYKADDYTGEQSRSETNAERFKRREAESMGSKSAQ